MIPSKCGFEIIALNIKFILPQQHIPVVNIYSQGIYGCLNCIHSNVKFVSINKQGSTNILLDKCTFCLKVQILHLCDTNTPMVITLLNK